MFKLLITDMLRSIVTVLICLPLFVSSQQLIAVNGLYCTPDSVPFTGQYTSYYPSGLKAAVYNLKDGQFHNSVTFYRESGSIDYTGYYDHGRKDGLWCSHDERGRVLSKIKYRKGQKTGEWIVRNDFDNQAFLMYFANDRLLSSRAIKPREAQILSRR